MTALRHEAIRLVEKMPEEQMPYIIQYIRRLNEELFRGMGFSGNQTAATPKIKAFLELEDMLVPLSQDLDYDRELAEARDEKYGHFG